MSSQSVPPEMCPTQDVALSQAFQHLKEVIAEDADLHSYVVRATQHHLGEDEPPLDGLYWSVYNRFIVQTLMRVAADQPVSM